MKLYDELVARELVYGITDEAIIEKLNNDKITFYLGLDPTESSLHVGHLCAVLLAKRLQQFGHNALIVVGGGTGMIGDPRPTTERELLTLEQTKFNAEAIKNQVQSLFKAEILNNYDWLSKIDLIELLRDYGKYFNLNNMLAKETVKSRLETGISFTEFTYQILQGIDFYTLYKEKNCTLQISGSDQWGNIISGIDLIKKKLTHENHAYGLTMPLVTKSDGTKFSKSEGTAVWLDAKRTSVFDFYQFWINTPDADVISFLRKFTFLSLEKIKEIEKDFKENPHLRVAQKTLAYEITKILHKDKVNDALRLTDALFKDEYKLLNSVELKEIFKEVPSCNQENISLVEALVMTKLAKSNREARDFIKSNAIAINGMKISDLEFIITKELAFNQEISIIKKGKKHYAIIEH